MPLIIWTRLSQNKREEKEAEWREVGELMIPQIGYTRGHGDDGTDDKAYSSYSQSCLGVIGLTAPIIYLQLQEICMPDTILFRIIARNASFVFLTLLVTSCSSTKDSSLEAADATCIRQQVASLPIGTNNTLEEDAHACHVQVPDLTNDFDLQQRAHVEGLPFLKTKVSSVGTSRYYCHTPVSVWAKAWSPFPSNDGCRLVNFTAASS